MNRDVFAAALESGQTSFDIENFDDADLRGLNLTNLHFSGCTFHKADLSGTIMSGCSFYVCEFVDANMRDIFSSRSIFDGSVFKNTNLTESTFSSPTRLFGCSFEGANLQSSKMSGVNAARAGFEGANLTNADLSNSTLTGADFFKSTLTGANFKKADLYNATGFKQVVGFDKADFTGTLFETAWRMMNTRNIDSDWVNHQGQFDPNKFNEYVDEYGGHYGSPYLYDTADDFIDDVMNELDYKAPTDEELIVINEWFKNNKTG